jgi:hypothetical protein
LRRRNTQCNGFNLIKGKLKEGGGVTLKQFSVTLVGFKRKRKPGGFPKRTNFNHWHNQLAVSNLRGLRQAS